MTTYEGTCISIALTDKTPLLFSAIFELLDRLVLISEGRTVYLGPAKDAGAFFAAQGLMCPPLFNQSDFFLDSISMVRLCVLNAAGASTIGRSTDSLISRNEQPTNTQQDYRTPELEAATRMRITALADAWAKEQGKLDGADDEEAGGAAAALVKVRGKVHCMNICTGQQAHAQPSPHPPNPHES